MLCHHEHPIMKLFNPSFWILVLLGSAPCALSAGTDAGYVPMKVTQTDFAVFPRHALTLGITEGEAQVVVSIDEQGRLTDCLATAYTHPSFAREAVAVVRRWRYEPARIDGVPQGATAEFNFDFKSKGLVVV